MVESKQEAIMDKAERKKYLAEYQRNYIQVKVIIDKRKEDQMEMLEWLRSQGDVSTYIKNLIQQDMKKGSR